MQLRLGSALIGGTVSVRSGVHRGAGFELESALAWVPVFVGQGSVPGLVSAMSRYVFEVSWCRVGVQFGIGRPR